MHPIFLDPKNIVVRMPNWLGDLVMATPVLADLRHRFPDAKITAMCQSNISPLLLEDPHIDELLAFERPGGWIHRQQHWKIIEQLQQAGYDCGILLTNSFSSAWWFWRGRVRCRIGYPTHWRRLLLDIPVPIPKNINQQHLVITYKMLLQPLGIAVSPLAPALYVTRQELQAAQEHLEQLGLKQGQQIVGINPGAAYGSAKCWLPERFKEVTKRLLEDQNIFIIYFGDRNGAPLVNDICQEGTERLINLAGKTSIRELMALIKLCHAFLTNDSGPMHMAAALNTPLLALFGSTSDLTTGPYKNGTVIHKHVPCSPCYRRECPIDFRCMTQIGVDQVYSELRRILKQQRQ